MCTRTHVTQTHTVQGSTVIYWSTTLPGLGLVQGEEESWGGGGTGVLLQNLCRMCLCGKELLVRWRGRGGLARPPSAGLPLACLSHSLPGISLWLTHPSSGQVSLPVSWGLPSQPTRGPSFYVPPRGGDRWFLQNRARPDWRESPSLGEQLHPYMGSPIC